MQWARTALLDCSLKVASQRSTILDALDEIYAPDYVVHRLPFSDVEGPEAYKQCVADSHAVYAPLHMMFDDIVLEGDTWAVGLWTAKATHTGQSAALPIPPTGKQITMVQCNVNRAKKGKWVETWEYGDWLEMLQQPAIDPRVGEGRARHGGTFAGGGVYVILPGRGCRNLCQEVVTSDQHTYGFPTIWG